MGIMLIIICGAIVGYAASRMKGSGFGLWWDIYLGVAGSALASCLMIYLYFMYNFPIRIILGLNLYAALVAVTGALVLIYLPGLIKNYPASLRVAGKERKFI